MGMAIPPAPTPTLTSDPTGATVTWNFESIYSIARAESRLTAVRHGRSIEAENS